MLTLLPRRPQAIPGLVRTINSFSSLPVNLIAGPLSTILDASMLTFSAYSLATGSKTTVSKYLRAISVQLRSSRIQMQIWRHGSALLESRVSTYKIVQILCPLGAFSV